MVPRPEHSTGMAYPLYGTDGYVSGWYRFEDTYLQPEVLYGSWPPITSIKLGGRTIEVDRPVPVKVKLLEPNEDRTFWCSKKQHAERVNLGEFHRDFGDVEVAYSFSSPQTHVFLSGYSIHFDEFEQLAFSSYNATVRARPEHVLGTNGAVVLGRQDKVLCRSGGGTGYDMAVQPSVEAGSYLSLNDGCCSQGGTARDSPATPMDSERNTVLACGLAKVGNRAISVPHTPKQDSYFPLYSCQVPVVREPVPGVEVVDYRFTPAHLNDCERDINLRDEFNIGVGISSTASPVSVPPVFPPLRPYEIPELIILSNSHYTKGGLHPNQVLRLKKHGRNNERHHHKSTSDYPPPPQLPPGTSTSSSSLSPLSPLSPESTESANPKDSSCLSEAPCSKIARFCLSVEDVANRKQDYSSDTDYERDTGSDFYLRENSNEYVDRKKPKRSFDPRKSALSFLREPQYRPGKSRSWSPWDGYIVDYRRPNNIAPWVDESQIDAGRNLMRLAAHDEFMSPATTVLHAPPVVHRALSPSVLRSSSSVVASPGTPYPSVYSSPYHFTT